MEPLIHIHIHIHRSRSPFTFTVHYQWVIPFSVVAEIQKNSEIQETFSNGLVAIGAVQYNQINDKVRSQRSTPRPNLPNSPTL